MAMMMLVPIYFQITDRASFTTAGAHLRASVFGNAVRGLLTGYVIHKTGTYKPILLIAAFSCTTAYTLLLLRWHGHTSFLESLYIIPGGFGNGIALSATFIGLTAGVEQEELAIASSGLLLSSNVGTVIGLSVAGSVMEGGLEKGLRIALEGWEGREKIIKRALSDIDYVRDLEGKLGEVVTSVYVNCLSYTHAVSVFAAIAALIAACCMKQHRL